VTRIAPQKEWSSRKELAEWLGYVDDNDEPNVRPLEWADYTGTGPRRYVIAGKVRYHRDDIAEWVAQRAIEPGAKAG